jgi:hypothetical protein
VALLLAPNKSTLIIYDDLSKQAQAYRQMFSNPKVSIFLQISELGGVLLCRKRKSGIF